MKIVLFSGLAIMSLASMSPTTTFATTDSETIGQSETSTVEQAVNDFLKNHLKGSDKNLKASYSQASIQPYYGQELSYQDFITKVPFIRDNVVQDLASVDSKKLSGVKFSYKIQVMSLDHSYTCDTYEQYAHDRIHGEFEGHSAIPTGINIYATYNGQPIGISQYISYYDNQSFSNPIKSTGVVVNNNKITMLKDTENASSNRGVSPNTAWTTDQFKVDFETGQPAYRVSTTEWLPNPTFKTQDNSGIVLSGETTSPLSTYTVSNRGTSGETLYKSNGDVWDYTLPNDSSWKATGIAWDQFNVPYYQVSTDAWVRGNGN